MSLTIVSQRGYDWRHSRLQELLKALSIGTIYIAHETKVNPFASHGATVGTDDIEIGTRETEGVDAAFLQLCHNVLVDQPCIDHRHDLQHFCIRDAATTNHLALDTELSRNICSSASTAMNQNLWSSYLRKFIEQNG